MVNIDTRYLPLLGTPVNCPVQSGRAALAVLFEAQVDRCERAVYVSDAVDGEPALQGIAAAPITIPREATQHWIIKRVALKTRVITGLKLADRIHGLEVASPQFVSIDGET